MVRLVPRGDMLNRGHPAATSPTGPAAIGVSLLLAAERSCSSLTAGGGDEEEEELPKMLDPRPDVMEESPQPPTARVSTPHRQMLAPARAAFMADCVIAPRASPCAASYISGSPDPLGRRWRLPVLLRVKTSTPNEPRPSVRRQRRTDATETE